MNCATFFKHFELLADQPDAVAKMRESVWHWAAQSRTLGAHLLDSTLHQILAA